MDEQERDPVRDRVLSDDELRAAFRLTEIEKQPQAADNRKGNRLLRLLRRLFGTCSEAR